MALYGLPGGISPDALNQLMGQARGSWSSANPAMQQDVSEWTQLAQLLGYTPNAFPAMGTAGQDEARFLNTMKSIMDQQLGAFGEGTQINQLPGNLQQLFQMFAPLMTSAGAARSVAPVGTQGMMSQGYQSGPLPQAMSPLIQLAMSAMQSSNGASQTSANPAQPANANPAFQGLPEDQPPSNAFTTTPAQSSTDLARYGPEGQQYQQDPANQSIAAALAARQNQPGFITDPAGNPPGAVPGVNAGPSGEPATGPTGANIGAVLSNLMQNPQMGRTILAALMQNPQTRPFAMAMASMADTGGGSMGSIVPGISLIQQLQQASRGTNAAPGSDPTRPQYVTREQNPRRVN